MKITSREYKEYTFVVSEKEMEIIDNALDSYSVNHKEALDLQEQTANALNPPKLVEE